MKQKTSSPQPTKAKLEKRLKRQEGALDKYKRQDSRLRWSVASACVVIFLLLLLLGTATDWTVGLHKDKVTESSDTPVSSALDSAHPSTGSGADSTNTGSTSKATTGSSTTTDRTTTDNSSTTSGSSTVSGGNTNGSTTNSDGDSTSDAPTPLLDLYTGSSVGNDINSVL